MEDDDDYEDVYAKNEAGRTALHDAVLRGDVAAAQALVARGAAVDDDDLEGRSALHYAAAGDGADALALVGLLLDAGAFVDIVDGDGKSPLMVAALGGNEPMATLLLQRGQAYIQLEDNAGVTAVEMASKRRIKGLISAELAAREAAAMAEHGLDAEGAKQRWALEHRDRARAVEKKLHELRKQQQHAATMRQEAALRLVKAKEAAAAAEAALAAEEAARRAEEAERARLDAEVCRTPFSYRLVWRCGLLLTAALRFFYFCCPPKAALALEREARRQARAAGITPAASKFDLRSRFGGAAQQPAAPPPFARRYFTDDGEPIVASHPTKPTPAAAEGTGVSAVADAVPQGLAPDHLAADLTLSRDRTGYLPWGRRALLAIEVRACPPFFPLTVADLYPSLCPPLCVCLPHCSAGRRHGPPAHVPRRVPLGRRHQHANHARGVRVMDTCCAFARG